mmetsp:Transcript_33666/g.78683  ORF Transcript_33666/g.78683 Transcript_33666/m.78683 type:complete len:432 (-) Transcript_33666:36-1331(-)
MGNKKSDGDDGEAARQRLGVTQTMLLFYVRFLMVLAPIVGSSGLFNSLITRISWLVVAGVLGRRWLRCQRSLPSGDCTGFEGKALEPTLEGLHKRFLEHFSGAPLQRDCKSFEAMVLKMLQFKTMTDGQKIAYWDVGPREAKEVVILVNGLGGRIACWVPLFDALMGLDPCWKQKRFVIPEYRGQFASMPLVGVGAVSVEQSATDILELATSLSITSATLLCWSTGVQVGLEVALKRPSLPTALVLIQGTTGQALEAIGQPLCTMFGMPALLSLGLNLLPPSMKRSGAREFLHSQMEKNGEFIQRFASLILWVFGTDLQAIIAPRYVKDMMQSDAHFTNYCGYALALGKHKLFGRLAAITAPSLVITGTPDFVTPARCSYQLSALLGGPEVELYDDVSASHYFIYEEPHKVANRVHTFLQRVESPAADASS